MKRSYPGSDLDREVAAAVDVIYEDLSERRWDALEAHFLPEASLVFSTPKGPTRMSPPKFIEMMQKNLEGKTVFGERMAHAWVRTHGAMAMVWSTFEGRLGTETEVKTWAGVDCWTLVNVQGRWKISQVTVSVDPPPKAD